MGATEMTELRTTFDQKSDTVAGSSAAPVTNRAGAPALISEQQVLFSTASATALPPVTTRRFSDAIHTVARVLGAVLAGSEKPPAQRHYPKRHVWLESSLMSREMDRL
jgi:hypothetical protein